MLFWTFLAVALLVFGITESNSNMLFSAIPVGLFAIIGWVITIPLFVHRVKVVIKGDKIFAKTQPAKKMHQLLLSMWNDGGNGLLPPNTWHSFGMLVRWSWKPTKQQIDLSKIVEARVINESFRPFSRGFGVNVYNPSHRYINIDFILLRDVDGVIHMIEMTRMREKNQDIIVSLIDERVEKNEHLNANAKSAIVPKRPLSRQEIRADRHEERRIAEHKQRQEKKRFEREGTVFARGNHSVRLVQAPTDKTKAISIITKRLGFTVEQATEIVDNAPRLIVDRIAEQDARTLTRELRALGATVEFR